MLSLLQLVAPVSIVLAALMGKGARDLYFGIAIVGTLIGFACLSNISTPAQLLALSEAERIGADRLNALAPPTALMSFAVAVGAAIAACVFRVPRSINETEEGQ